MLQFLCQAWCGAVRLLLDLTSGIFSEVAVWSHSKTRMAKNTAKTVKNTAKTVRKGVIHSL